MATLTSTKIKNTYDALLKSIDNDAIGSTAKQITDGLGNTTPLYISTTQVGIGVTPESGLNLHVYGDAKIGSNLTVIGNLVVEGSTTTVGTDTLTVKDPLIVLANNNTSTDAVDIGFYGKYTPSGTTLYSGLFREALTGKYRLFKGLQIEPTTTVSISGTGYDKADLVIGNIETNGVVEDSSLFTFSKDVIINKAGTTKLTIDNVTQNKSIELECTSLNNVLNAEGDMIFSSGSPIFKYTSSSFEVLNVDSTFGGDITVSTGTEGGAIFLGSSASVFSEQGITFKDTDTTIQNAFAGGDIVFKTKTGAGSQNTHLTLFADGTSAFTGQVTIPLTPSANTDAASKGYVDTQVGANNELSEVLANGNITDGTDIVVSTGDQILLPDGSSTSPAITFSGDTNTGMYRTGSDVLNLGVGGSDAISMFPTTVYIKPAGSTELTISGSGSTFAGNVDINGNLDVTSTASDAVFLRSSQATTTNVYITNTNATANNTANLFFAPANNVAGSYIKSTAIEDFSTSANRTSDLRFAVRKDGTFNEALIIDSSGNVGIGVTPEAWTGYAPVLQIGDRGAIAHWANDSLTIGDNWYYDGTNKRIEAGFATRMQINSAAGSFLIENAGNDVADSTITFASRFLIDSSGNVGIGGSASTFANFTNVTIQGGSSGSNLDFKNSSGTRVSAIVTTASNELIIETGTAQPIIFKTNDTEKMRIDSSGRMLLSSSLSYNFIGNNTSDGSDNERLFISGGGDASAGRGGLISFYGNEYTSDGGNVSIQAGRTSGANINFFTGETTTTERMRIDSSGNVGIGTDSPNYKLEIESTSDADLVSIKSTAIANNTQMRLGISGNDSVISGTGGSTGSLVFKTYGSERMRIDSSGNVAIGFTGTNNYKFYILDAVDRGISDAQIHINANGYSGFHYLNATGYHIQQNSDYRSLILISGTSGGVKLTAGATAWVSNSDESLKENIKPLENVLDKIKDYRCVEYNLKANEDKKIGFIAQDWEEDYPQIVDKDDEGLLGMKYTETIPVLLKAIQELKAEIDDLKNKCNCK